MNTDNTGQAAGGIKGKIKGFSIRSRITLAILLSFLLVLPVVALSLFYLSDLLSTMQMITNRDVKLGRMAADLTFAMLNIQRLERNYRVFGSPVERESIENLIAQADSLVESARALIPESERDIIDELDHRLDTYRNSFEMLAAYLSENPPDVRVQRIRSGLIQQFDEFEQVFRRLRSQLETAAPAQRDSILAAADKYVEKLSIDQIAAFNESDTATPQNTIQQSLDTARREFLQTSQRFAMVNWRNMEENNEEAVRIEARADRNIIFVLILTAAACLIMIIKLPGYIVKPITRLSSMLRKAGNGELAFHTAVTSRDEIGDLAAAYNQAIDRIRAYDDLKTKKIASQKRSIERLIDYFNLPVCILTKNLTALYYNGPFASLFGPSVPSKAPENGLDIAKIPEMEDFFEQLRKRTAPVGGDFHFTFIAPDGSEVSLRGRPVRNAALVLENIIVVGEVNRNNKHEG